LAEYTGWPVRVRGEAARAAEGAGDAPGGGDHAGKDLPYLGAVTVQEDGGQPAVEADGAGSADHLELVIAQGRGDLHLQGTAGSLGVAALYGQDARGVGVAYIHRAHFG
jgi:hypothetical protein